MGTNYTEKLSGVHVALERICALEARLRAAIQTMQPLSTSLTFGSNTADRERQALLAVRCEVLQKRFSVSVIARRR